MQSPLTSNRKSHTAPPSQRHVTPQGHRSVVCDSGSLSLGEDLNCKRVAKRGRGQVTKLHVGDKWPISKGWLHKAVEAIGRTPEWVVQPFHGVWHLLQLYVRNHFCDKL